MQIGFIEDMKKQPVPMTSSKKQYNRTVKSQKDCIIRFYNAGYTEQELIPLVEKELHRKVRADYVYQVISTYIKQAGQGIARQGKGDSTRLQLLQYIRMGMSAIQIANSMGLSRGYVFEIKKDAVVLGYIEQGSLSPEAIARILGIPVSRVTEVREKYRAYFSNK